VGNEHLEQVVCHLIELINLLDMSSDNGLLFLEDADSSVDFHVHFVLILEVFQGNWHFVLTLLVKNDLESAGVIVDLEQSPHGLLRPLNNTAYDDDLTEFRSTMVFSLHR